MPATKWTAARPEHDLNKSRNEAWINSTPIQTGADPTMTDTPHPAATATQKVVAAMWSMQQPATAKQIAEAAAVGYSTVTPILRNLHAERQATKTDTDGRTLWYLTAGTPTAALNLTGGAAAAAESIALDDVESPVSATDSADVPRADRDADPAEPHDRVASADTPAPDDDNTAEPSGVPSDGVPAADLSAPLEAVTTEQQETTPPQDGPSPAGTRPYRKPAQPRRAKGALRDAVLKVLTDAPDTGFKVGDVCKAINSADTDATANKAGAGAVANALTKLVTDGHAVQVVDKPATFQAVPPAAETD
jgi:hypothetical protein